MAEASKLIKLILHITYRDRGDLHEQVITTQIADELVEKPRLNLRQPPCCYFGVVIQAGKYDIIHRVYDRPQLVAEGQGVDVENSR